MHHYSPNGCQLEELLPQLVGQQAILVTGPQRSGTTIAAHIIANRLGYRYIDEGEFSIDDVGRAKQLIRQGHVVLQAPALCHVAHTFGCAVVMMRRPLAEIHNSERRVHWNGCKAKAEGAKYGVDGSQVAEAKYKRWDEEQKFQCLSFNLDYYSLSANPLWRDAQWRKRFAIRQWQ